MKSTFFTDRTTQLAGTYLAIIMAMSMLFSGVIFALANDQMRRPEPQHRNIPDNSLESQAIDDVLRARAERSAGELLLLLVFLNLVMLVFGAFFSYFLARKSLEPIEQAMLAQSRFVSDASHELRTPLAVMQTTNEVALRKKSLTLPDARKVLATNVDEVIRLHGLTEALLGLLSTESSENTRQNVDIKEQVDSAMQGVAILAEEKSIIVKNTVSSKIIPVDIQTLDHVLRNLLDNAVKYSPSGAEVLITSEEHGKETWLHVIDKGPGIAPEHHEKIFERFYRTDEARSQHANGGYGLGLAIAKTLSERAGMKLKVASEIGKGSTFSVRVS